MLRHLHRGKTTASVYLRIYPWAGPCHSPVCVFHQYLTMSKPGKQFFLKSDEWTGCFVL